MKARTAILLLMALPFLGACQEHRAVSSLSQKKIIIHQKQAQAPSGLNDQYSNAQSWSEISSKKTRPSKAQTLKVRRATKSEVKPKRSLGFRVPKPSPERLRKRRKAITAKRKARISSPKTATTTKPTPKLALSDSYPKGQVKVPGNRIPDSRSPRFVSPKPQEITLVPPSGNHRVRAFSTWDKKRQALRESYLQSR